MPPHHPLTLMSVFAHDVARVPRPLMLPLIAWTPALVAAALALAAAFMAVLLWQRKRGKPGSQPLPTEWALSPRPVFSSDERRLYRQLREALPQHVVLAKLPLVRFCQPLDPRRVHYWYDLLAGSHVAFAICSASGRVLAAVDIETERCSSRRTQIIKRSVLEACRVRYMRCAPGKMPSVGDLQGLLPLPLHNVSMAPPAPSPVEQSRERLSNTVASRRQARQNTHWPDSAFADSQFRDSSFSESRYSSLLPIADPLVRDSASGGLGGSVVVEGPVTRPSRPSWPT